MLTCMCLQYSGMEQCLQKEKEKNTMSLQKD